MEYEEAENTQSEQQKKKKNPKKWGYCKEPLGQFQAFQHLHHGVPKGEEREEGIENLFEKIMMEDFPNLVKEIDL